MPDGDDLLEAIRRRVKTLAVRSLVTIHDLRHGQWHVVLRVRGRVPAAAKS